MTEEFKCVQCMVCGKTFYGKEAQEHWEKTNHNNWEIILPGEAKK